MQEHSTHLDSLTDPSQDSSKAWSAVATVDPGRNVAGAETDEWIFRSEQCDDDLDLTTGDGFTAGEITNFDQHILGNDKACP